MNKRNIHNLSVGLWCLYVLFVESSLPKNLFEKSYFVSPIIGFLLLVISIYYLIRKQDENRNKTFEEITGEENVGNYMQLLLILYLTDIFYFYTYNPFGVWIRIGLYAIILISTIIALIKDWKSKKEVFIGHLILGGGIAGYLMYSNIVNYYGNEIIGSYWAKPDFRTEYIVKLSKSRESQKEYALPALVHVFSETFDSYDPTKDWDTSDSYTVGYIILEKVYLDNGDYLMFFGDCNLEIGEKIYCTDQHNNSWYIELTDEKVE